MSKTIAGDVAIGRHVYTGGDANVAGSATIKGNVKVDGWLDAKNIKYANKGLFPTLDKLKEAYPEPKRGWYALVGETIPALIYIVVDGEWVNSDKMSNDLNVDLTDYVTTGKLSAVLQGYATKDDVEGVSDELNAHKASMVSEVGRINAELAEQRTDINGAIALSNNALEVANQASAQVGEISGKVEENQSAIEALRLANANNAENIASQGVSIDEHALTLETHTSLIAENTSALESISAKNIEQDKKIDNAVAMGSNNSEAFALLENQLMSFKDEVDVRDAQEDNKFSNIETTNAKQTLWHEAHSIVNIHRFISQSVIEESLLPDYVGMIPTQLRRNGLIVMANSSSGWGAWILVDAEMYLDSTGYVKLDWDNSLLITEVNALKSKINSEVANLTLEDEILASKIEEMDVALTAEVDLRKAKDAEQDGKISDIDNQIKSQQVMLSDMEGKLTNHTDDVATLFAKIEALEAKVLKLEDFHTLDIEPL